MEPDRPGRPYDSTLRRERAAATRERIVTAGTELLHAGPVRDWKRLTVRAVAVRAGVSERTVYRHFGNERGLTDAVMHRLEQEAGIDLAGMGLDDIATVATRILDHVASYPMEPPPLLTPPWSTPTDARRRHSSAPWRRSWPVARRGPGPRRRPVRRPVERRGLRAPRR